MTNWASRRHAIAFRTQDTKGAFSISPKLIVRYKRAILRFLSTEQLQGTYTTETSNPMPPMKANKGILAKNREFLGMNKKFLLQKSSDEVFGTAKFLRQPSAARLSEIQA